MFKKHFEISGGAVFAIGCTVNLAGVYAGKILHCNLLATILAAPAFFFDTTPVGRILNRFAHDTDVIDINLPRNFRSWCFQFLKALTVPIVVGYSTPLFLTTIPPAIIVYYFAQVKMCRVVYKSQELFPFNVCFCFLCFIISITSYHLCIA